MRLTAEQLHARPDLRSDGLFACMNFSKERSQDCGKWGPSYSRNSGNGRPENKASESY